MGDDDRRMSWGPPVLWISTVFFGASGGLVSVLVCLLFMSVLFVCFVLLFHASYPFVFFARLAPCEPSEARRARRYRSSILFVSSVRLFCLSLPFSLIVSSYIYASDFCSYFFFSYFLKFLIIGEVDSQRTAFYR